LIAKRKITSWLFSQRQLKNSWVSNNLKQHIGLKVRTARDRKSWTQEKLASEVGIAVESVSNLERGRHMVSLDTLLSVAGALEKPIRYFFDDAEREMKLDRFRSEAEAEARSLLESFADDDLRQAVKVLRALADER